MKKIELEVTDSGITIRQGTGNEAREIQIDRDYAYPVADFLATSHRPGEKKTFGSDPFNEVGPGKLDRDPHTVRHPMRSSPY